MSSLVAQMVKKLLYQIVVQETRAQSLDWEDPLENGMAAHSSIAFLEIPWAEEPGGLQSMESQRVRHDWATNTLTFTFLTRWDPATLRHDGVDIEMTLKNIQVRGLLSYRHPCLQPKQCSLKHSSTRKAGHKPAGISYSLKAPPKKNTSHLIYRDKKEHIKVHQQNLDLYVKIRFITDKEMNGSV